MQRYNPKTIESKWQKVWAENGLYKTTQDPGANKYYSLVMFPYPSGNLHVGHWYNFAPADTVSRFKRMSGHQLLDPIGFDSFGLPAENAAIKNKIPPASWTNQNIDYMTKQIGAMGNMYDMDKVIWTSDPDYYRWTQWIFLKLFEKGYAYKKKGVVNWCPKDQTVLANEQVVGDDDVCERCGTPVIQKDLEQWYFRITAYAERLLEDSQKLDWPDRVLTMQENWIGKSSGAEIDFAIDGIDEYIRIFTTRPDTIFGATFMVLAPEHPLVRRITTNDHYEEVEEYTKKVLDKSELERKQDEKNKTGVFTGAHAINPANGEKIPIWVSDFVLMSYGQGAIMAVPGHDQRDYDFANSYKLPIKKVVEPEFGEPSGEDVDRQSVIVILKHWSEEKYLVLDWGPRRKNYGGRMFIGGGIDDGEDIEATAEREIVEETGYKNFKLIKKLDHSAHNYFYSNVKNKHIFDHSKGLVYQLSNDEQIDQNLDDGEDKFKLNWVESSKLPSSIDAEIHAYMFHQLVEGKMYSSEGTMINSNKFNGMHSASARESIVDDLSKSNVAKERINYRLRDWLVSRQRYWGAPIPLIHCDKCGTVSVPYDQLPVKLPENVEFAPSGQSPLVNDENFVNTNCPECDGPAKRETETLDTFVDSSWYFLRYPNTKYEDGPYDPEAVAKWGQVDHYIGGIEHAILHLLYARFITKFLHDHNDLPFDEPFKKLSNQGTILGPDGLKMSKSKGNVVDPDEQVASYGADSLRLYLMFMGPYDQGGPYDFGGIAGVRRFLERAWELVDGLVSDKSDELDSNKDEFATKLTIYAQKTVKKVSSDLEKLSFNTAIAAMMELINNMNKLKKDLPYSANRKAWQENLEILVKLLAPFAPHISEELWQELGQKTSIHLERWPTWEESLIKDDLVTIVVQINGKVRANIEMEVDSPEDQIIAKIKSDEKVASYLENKEIKKTIYIKNKLVSFVIRD